MYLIYWYQQILFYFIWYKSTISYFIYALNKICHLSYIDLYCNWGEFINSQRFKLKINFKDFWNKMNLQNRSRSSGLEKKDSTVDLADFVEKALS